MMEKVNKLTNKRLILYSHSTKSIKVMVMFIFFSVFFIGTVSAFEFDNVKSYDEKNREYTITNALGLGDEIARIKLTSDLNQLVPRGYQKVAEFTVQNYDNYTNVFNDMEFYNLKNNSEFFVRSFDYKYKTIIQVPDYVTVCDKNLLGNGTAININCRQEQIGLKEVEDWVEINKIEGLSKGNLTIGIFTDVKKGDKVEWIPTLFGERLTEWAGWVESNNVGLVAYYKLDRASGSVIDEIGNHDGINYGATPDITGQINKSYLFVASENDRINISETLPFPFMNEVTVAAWFNFTTKGANRGVVLRDNNDLFIGTETTEGINFQGTGFNIGIGGASNYNVNQWYYVVGTLNGTTANIYVNGSLIESVEVGTPSGTGATDLLGGLDPINQDFDGLIDEVAIWNRTLNASEILDIYDAQKDGFINGSYTNVFLKPIINLNSPINTFNTTNQTIDFNGTVTSSIGVTNVTLFIDGVLNETNSSGINDTDYLFSKIIAFGNHTWTYKSCNDNGCTKLTTRTFSITNFIENTVTFNAEVLETSLQTFELNISTIPDILSVSAFLNYNGTRDVSISSCVGLNCSIRNTIDIPLSVLESENKSFFWEITVFDGSTSITTNTTTNEQNVSRIHLETCDATFTVQSLNFTAHDEQNLTRISPYRFEGTFDIWLGEGSVKRNNNFSDSSITEKTLCILPSEETYFVDSQIEYNEPANITYVTRNYYFQNDTISNVSQDISLYLLKSGFSTSFILKVQDDNLLPLGDHLIIIQRFYSGENLFRTVQIAKTSENGKTIGFFETEIVDYRFIIKLNGRTLLTTTQQKIVGEVAPFTLTFTIGVDLGKPWKTLENLTNLDFSLIFNKSTNVVTYTYVDTSGNFTLGTLIVQKQNFSFSTNTNLCSSNSSQASATITCNLTSNGTGTFVAKGFITRGSIETLISQINFIIESFLEVVGMLGVLLAWFIILISSFAFKFNEIAGIFMINATVIFVNIIGLVSFGMLAISALVAVSIIIVVVMEK